MNENCKVKKMQPISKHSLNTRLSDQPPKVKKSVTVISHNRRSGDNYGDVAGNTLIDTKFLHSKNCTTKYTKPELNSTLQLAKRMETLRNTTNVKLTDFNQMTPRTKSIATEKALKKLNFPSDKAVYKHLVPINVNDSVLDVRPSSTVQRSTTKFRVETVKDPVPTLSHYLKPMPRLEHRLTLDDDDSDGGNDKSIDRMLTNQFKRMYEFYEQYLCPISARVHTNCDSANVHTP